MSLDAISAVGTTATPLTPGAPTAGPDATAVPAASVGGTSSTETGDFARALEGLHDRMTRSGLGGPPADPVAKEVQSLLPSPWLDSAASRVTPETAAVPAAGHETAVDTLKRSFDHAIFVTLVGQVMGGVSRSASTLIHQS